MSPFPPSGFLMTLIRPQGPQAAPTGGVEPLTPAVPTMPAGEGEVARPAPESLQPAPNRFDELMTEVLGPRYRPAPQPGITGPAGPLVRPGVADAAPPMTLEVGVAETLPSFGDAPTSEADAPEEALWAWGDPSGLAVPLPPPASAPVPPAGSGPVPEVRPTPAEGSTLAERPAPKRGPAPVGRGHAPVAARSLAIPSVDGPPVESVVAWAVPQPLPTPSSAPEPMAAAGGVQDRSVGLRPRPLAVEVALQPVASPAEAAPRAPRALAPAVVQASVAPVLTSRSPARPRPMQAPEPSMPAPVPQQRTGPMASEGPVGPAGLGTVPSPRPVAAPMAAVGPSSSRPEVHATDAASARPDPRPVADLPLEAALPTAFPVGKATLPQRGTGAVAVAPASAPDSPPAPPASPGAGAGPELAGLALLADAPLVVPSLRSAPVPREVVASGADLPGRSVARAGRVASVPGEARAAEAVDEVLRTSPDPSLAPSFVASPSTAPEVEPLALAPQGLELSETVVGEEVEVPEGALRAPEGPVRVQIDGEVAVEVELQGDRVHVVVESTAAAAADLQGLQDELRAELASHGHDLGYEHRSAQGDGGGSSARDPGGAARSTARAAARERTGGEGDDRAERSMPRDGHAVHRVA